MKNTSLKEFLRLFRITSLWVVSLGVFMVVTWVLTSLTVEVSIWYLPILMFWISFIIALAIWKADN